MPKQWWSSRSMFVAQTACLLALIAWSVHHAPGETGAAKSPAAKPAVDTVIDNSEDTADNTSSGGTIDARFSVPSAVRFRTENPAAGTLNLRPVEGSAPPQRSAPGQPVRQQNPPPQRSPGGPRSPFEVNGKSATVYNAPPADTDAE